MRHTSSDIDERSVTVAAPGRSHRRLLWVAGATVATAALAIGALWAFQPPAANTIAAPVDTGPVYSGSTAGVTGVCGFDGPLGDKIVANRPANQSAPAPSGWTLSADADLGYLAVTDDEVVVEQRSGDTTRFEHYGQDGTLRTTTTLAQSVAGRWTAASDGTVYVLDPSPDTPVVERVTRDGSTSKVARVAPSSGAPADGPRQLVWVPEYRGGPALLLEAGGGRIQALRTDGESLGTVDDAAGALLGVTGGDTLVTAAATSSGDDLTLQAVDLSTGAVSLHAVVDTRATTAGDTSRTPSPSQLTSIVAGPDGDGFLAASRYSIQWMDGVGVRKGIVMDGQDGLDMSTLPALVEHGGRYWMLARDDDGKPRVVTMTADEMRTRMASPLSLTADSATETAQLGLGIGAVTHVAFNHFDAGTDPTVLLRTEDGWGGLDGVDRSRYEVRYRVNGDPTLADPVVQETRTAEIPWGGGETALELPATRPGAYQIDLTLVDPSDGSVRAGSCLHYSVGATGADLSLGTLAAGDEWGGAGPLRSVQLADRLGIGSARVQLDFGSLVTSPTASADARAIVWSALPGATDDAPFDQLRQAATYAHDHGITLAVQVGAGGDAELAAIRAGTWAGWAEAIVAGLAAQAPGITTWEAFNEPNNAGLSASDYWKTVEIPFADAAHRAQPGAFVIAGNTLGFANDWWQTAAASGVCEHVDAIGVHPYTGWNRSWEEEGFDRPDSGYAALRTALGSACASLPVWDTESGWTADSMTAYWAQGSNVARKLLWYEQEGVAGWTYFFSEGGWGENDLSWSLIQYRAYVKPGALSYAAVSRLLAGRGTPETVTTGAPFTHVMRVPGDDTLVVAWTDEARIDARVTTDAASVRVTDEYGAERTLDSSSGSAAVTLTATPQFFRVPAGNALTIDAADPLGPDVLRGAAVTATSTSPDADADPTVITSGTADPYRPWRSGDAPEGADDTPSVTVTLASPTTIDRIGVATGNISCCEAGLRGYTVSVQTSDGSWQSVAEPADQFWERTAIFAFPPVKAIAVRITAKWTTIRGVRMLDANYTSFSGGPPPPFMGVQTGTNYVMSVAAVSAWATTSP